MSNASIILLLGILYFGAHGFAFLFQKTRVPDVLILMLIGICIGPIGGLVTPESFGGAGDVLTTVALAVILFEGGLSLKLNSLASAAGATFILTATTAVVTLGLAALFAFTLLGLSTELSLLCGAILCGTSSAVVIPMVQALKMSEKNSTILILESALTDVICIVLVVAFLGAIQQGSFLVGSVAGKIGSSLSIACLIGMAGGVAWLKFWPIVRKFPTNTFTTIAFAFLLYGLTEIMGFSGAIATLVFGLTITNVPNMVPQFELPRMTESEHGFFQEVVFLLKTFFFVYLGISIQFSNLYLAFVALVFVIFAYFLRLWITRYALPLQSTPRDATLTALLIPKGLAAAVLAGLPKQMGIPEGDSIQLFVYSTILFSIVLTAVLVPVLESPKFSPFAQRFFQRYKGRLPEASQ